MPQFSTQFDPTEILTAEAISHVLDGEGAPSFRGGHRFTSHVVGKTVFPAHWSDSDIVAALAATIANPAKISVRMQIFVLFGLVDEVLIEITIEHNQSKPRLKHAFPKNGNGVFRNDPTSRTAIPLDLSELES